MGKEVLMPFTWMRAWAAAAAFFVAPLSTSALEGAEQLAQEAVESNPGLEELRAQKRALEQRVEAARVWKDPLFSVEYSNFPWNTWALGDSPMTGVQFRLQQTLPFPGKNERRQKTARARAELVDIQRAELANELRAAVRRGYYELALVRQLDELTQEHIERVGELRERVRLLYEVGRGDQKDVLQLELLTARLQDRLGDFDRNEAELVAAINAALHRDLATPIPTPTALPLVTPEVTTSALVKRAVEQRPALRAKEKQAEIHRLAAAQERYERWPDVSVWFGYRMRAEAGMDDGVDQLSIGASVPLPFDFTGRSGALAREQRELASATQLASQALVDDISEEIAKELARWRRSSAQARSYRETLIPKARQTLDAALLAYETDRADFWAVYRAELELIDLERTLRFAAAHALISRAQIEALIGAELGAGAVETKELSSTQTQVRTDP